jgi:monoterpene epsilon-lactone hydrolase
MTKKFILPILLCALSVNGAAFARPEPVQIPQTALRYQIPLTVSPTAKFTLERIYALIQRYKQTGQTEPKNAAEWDRRNAQNEALIGPYVKANVDKLGVTIKADTIGGVPVLRVTPPHYRPSNRILLYAHGGGYVLYSAKTTLTVPALLAVASGLEVVSIDYTLAPHAKWHTATDQIIAVYRSVLARHRPGAVGLLGDSAGGGLAAGSVLKMRDQGLALPGALYLLSPWADITNAGDSYTTLANSDPSLDAASLKWGADAYADPKDQKNPYVSPVYGDYSKAFPPTLIQGGTREIFLSNSVRQYDAIRNGNHEAVLDLYEGMPHVFQALAPAIPETQTAMHRAAAFFDLHLSRNR